MRLRISILTVLATFAGYFSWAQKDTIKLTNPSFEDVPRHSHVPRGWYDCGFPGESPPDTQPDPAATFQVSKASYDGNSYLGLVVRDNDTWESVSQKLTRPMEKNKCYEFSLQMARSESYVSSSRVTEEQANYTTPAKVRIYGGFDYCDKQYLLGESKLVINTRWVEYKMKFEPIGNYSHIIIEAFYNTPTLFPYNGNVLIDKASNLVQIPCDQPVADTEPEVKPAPVTKPPVKTETKKPATTTPKVTAKSPEKKEEPKKTEPTVAAKKEEPKDLFENVKISDISRSELKAGSTIRIDNLYFEANEAIILQNSSTVLDEMYNFLNRNPDMVVEVGGHANGLASTTQADRLSAERAKAIYDYLIKKGIPENRLKYKGYGKRKPIASDNTATGRQKNQRVEIKILSING